MKIFLLILALAVVLPATIIAPSGAISPGPAVAARKPKTVTKVFTNAAPITIGERPILESLPATPYPSVISVTDLKGRVTDIDVQLRLFGHRFPGDIDVLLVGPGGQTAIVLSDVGGQSDVTNLNLTLDDQASARLPDGQQLRSGAFRPTNLGETIDPFSAPAPAPSGDSALSIFNRSNPNGDWSLFVVDDQAAIDSGSIDAGWSLKIKTRVKKK